MCVCVYMCVWERESVCVRERQMQAQVRRFDLRVCLRVCVCVCLKMCVRERKMEAQLLRFDLCGGHD